MLGAVATFWYSAPLRVVINSSFVVAESSGPADMMTAQPPYGGRMRNWMLSSWRRMSSSALATSETWRRTLGTTWKQVWFPEQCKVFYQEVEEQAGMPRAPGVRIVTGIVLRPIVCFFAAHHRAAYLLLFHVLLT